MLESEVGDLTVMHVHITQRTKPDALEAPVPEPRLNGDIIKLTIITGLEWHLHLLILTHLFVEILDERWGQFPYFTVGNSVDQAEVVGGSQALDRGDRAAQKHPYHFVLLVEYADDEVHLVILIVQTLLDAHHGAQGAGSASIGGGKAALSFVDVGFALY